MKIKAEQRERRKKVKMKVSGKSVFEIQKILIDKSKIKSQRSKLQ